MRNSLWLSFLGVFYLVVTVFLSHPVLAHLNNQRDLHLELTPESPLFHIENMKPGDWASRSITIENKGKVNTNYHMKIQNKGEEKLFNELLLEVSDKDGELYNGKIADFSLLALSDLHKSMEKELDITIRIPEHLGNDYQELVVNMEFLFSAKTKKENETSFANSNNSGMDGSPLPETATNLFYFLLAGGLLVIIGIVFVLYKKKRVG